ncbi:hypothetical protein KP509_30G029300 [Ceratopteris richardii]|uniref:ABC transporter domain-containing protein n=1 Tax=Ceratopteris richardii TaxID=49495 RepID=A0A8T2R2S2_CERRI|nr:hypothetical protein KP509_30G029300 [Ceratopteris richardii]
MGKDVAVHMEVECIRVEVETLHLETTEARVPTELPETSAAKEQLDVEEDAEACETDVHKMDRAANAHLLRKLLPNSSQSDIHCLFSRIRHRFNRVGMELPKFKITFQNLSAEADMYVGERSLPTLFSYTINSIESLLTKLHITKTRKAKFPILEDLSGIIKPSRMTLLLGPPGSGKSTFLKALCGQTDHNLKVSGRVMYNAHSLNEFVPQRVAAYVSQHNHHICEMTVRETLDFSRRCQGVGTRHEMLTELIKMEKEAGIDPDPQIDLFMKAIAVEGQETNIMTDFVIKLLDLGDCADNVIGNELQRGISGGQKRRVTIGEALVGPSRILLMDDISTGLDSMTIHRIVQSLSNIVHHLDGTVLVSLLQPLPETFELFDDVLILAEGQIAYQGPRHKIPEFFAERGFMCPLRKSMPEFLQEVFSRKDQEKYWVKHNEPYRFISAGEFTCAQRSSKQGHRIRKEITLSLKKPPIQLPPLCSQMYGTSKSKLWTACFWRELLLMKRNLSTILIKIIQVSLISVITATVFFRKTLHPNNKEDAKIYMGGLFLGLINVNFSAFTELFATIKCLPVLHVQKTQLLYPCWIMVLTTATLRVIVSLVEAGFWVSLTYYEIGYTPEVMRFVQQFMVLLFTSQMAFGLFRLIGAISKCVAIANTYGSFILACIFMSAGFAITRENIKKWWIWCYWTSPLMYANNALAVNEFSSPRWNLELNGSNASVRIGQALMETHGLFTDAHWYAIGLGALAGFTFLFNLLYTLVLTYLNFFNRPQSLITDLILRERLRNKKGSIYTSAMETCPSLNREIRVIKDGDVGNQQAWPDCSCRTTNPVIEGMSLPFQPLCLTFRDINYYIDMPTQGTRGNRLQLLSNVNGVFKPRVLTALMGISGAGKTTLLDVLAGRKTAGYLYGDIRICGYPKKQETFNRIAGYCEQDDIHLPYVTVKESLIYSAWLRLPKEIDAYLKTAFLEEVMHLVELDNLSHAIVGSSGEAGITIEQKKRLSIAVELVANPSILFLDEPTSGLDARAAAIVIRTIRKAANTGRTVVCTIHQPGIEIFETFDELLLLKQGGKLIYAGQLGFRSRKLVQYFESIPCVPKLMNGMNPATWMLEVTASSFESQSGVNFAQQYEASSLFKDNQACIERMHSAPEGSKELRFPTKYNQNFVGQITVSLWRQHASYFRNPDYNVHRLAYTGMVAFLCGTFYWNFGSKITREVDLMNAMGGLYSAVIFLGTTNANMIQPVAGFERVVFYRERAAGMYSSFSYAFAQLMIEIPYNLLQSLIYGPIVYLMMNFERTSLKFFRFQFFVFSCFLYCTYFGMMLVGITPNYGISGMIASMIYSMWHLFSGFAIPVTRIPIWWKWCYWINPISWTLNGLITSQFGDINNIFLSVSGDQACTIAEYLRQYQGYRIEFLPVVAIVHVGIIVLFALLFAISMQILNFQKR